MTCGKQSAARPACVFWDADLCANDEFTLAFYTPYKQVAYTVWQAVSRKQPAPTPSYAEAGRMRVIIGLKPRHAAQNPVTGLTIVRGQTTINPSSRRPGSTPACGNRQREAAQAREKLGAGRRRAGCPQPQSANGRRGSGRAAG